MRTKSRTSEPVSESVFNKVYDVYGNLILTRSVGTETYSLTSESITYGSGKRHLNDCSHIWAKFSPTYGTYSFDYSPPSNATHYKGALPFTAYVSLPQPVPILGFDQFIMRGVQNLRPKFISQVSVPNFLFELKDLRRLIPSRKTFETYVRDLTTVFGNPFKQQKQARNLLSSASHLAASQHLNAQFGYLPLIRDAFNIVDAFANYNQKLDEFRMRSRKIQTGHYKEVIPAYDAPSELIQDNEEWSCSRSYRRSEVSIVLTLRYQYDILLPYLYPPDQFNKYIGFRNNPRILWDALPFSFIIDWFLKVGKALESFDEGAIPVQLNIVEACVSMKYQGVAKHYTSAKPFAYGNGTWNWGTDTLALEQGWRVYERRTLDPRSIVLQGMPPLPVADKLSVSELTLGLALGRSLKAKRH